MSDSNEDEVMLLALLIILRRRRKRRSQLQRRESPSHKPDLEQFCDSLSFRNKNKRIDGSQLNKSGKKACKNVKGAGDSLDMSCAIKLEPADFDDDWSSYEQKGAQGVIVKDEPIDDWSGVTDS